MKKVCIVPLAFCLAVLAACGTGVFFGASNQDTAPPPETLPPVTSQPETPTGNTYDLSLISVTLPGGMVLSDPETRLWGDEFGPYAGWEGFLETRQWTSDALEVYVYRYWMTNGTREKYIDCLVNMPASPGEKQLSFLELQTREFFNSTFPSVCGGPYANDVETCADSGTRVLCVEMDGRSVPVGESYVVYNDDRLLLKRGGVLGTECVYVTAVSRNEAGYDLARRILDTIRPIRDDVSFGDARYVPAPEFTAEDAALIDSCLLVDGAQADSAFRALSKRFEENPRGILLAADMLGLGQRSPLLRGLVSIYFTDDRVDVLERILYQRDEPSAEPLADSCPGAEALGEFMRQQTLLGAPSGPLDASIEPSREDLDAYQETHSGNITPICPQPPDWLGSLTTDGSNELHHWIIEKTDDGTYIMRALPRLIELSYIQGKLYR